MMPGRAATNLQLAGISKKGMLFWFSPSTLKILSPAACKQLCPERIL